MITARKLEFSFVQVRTRSGNARGPVLADSVQLLPTVEAARAASQAA